MKPCKAAYKIVRKNDSEIYKGFGFRHLSDATAYYVHRNNESYKGTTTLCQTIGEAVIMFAEYLSRVLNDKQTEGDILTDETGNAVWIELPVPADWRENGITDTFCYRANMDGTSLIKCCPLDRDGKYMKSAPSDVEEHYLLLPVIIVLLVRLLVEDEEYAGMLMDFVRTPGAAAFVTLHEDLYQHFKNNEFIISSRELSIPPETCKYSLKAKLLNIRKNKEEITYDNIEIMSFPNEHFPECYRELVPELSEEFRLPDKLRPLCSAVTAGDMRSVLLYGPAGTGKTMACKLICRETGLPVMETVNCTENLDEFILGKYLPEGDRIVFKESYVTKAIRFGGAVIFEEINFARPQYLAFLNSLLDDNGFVRLDSGETVKRHKDFRFFATMNIGYYGTRELNQALYNRFNAVVEMDELADEAIERMLEARIPDCAPFIKDMLEVYHRIRSKAQAEELDLVISPRNLENWARMAVYEGYVAAAEKTIVPIARSDRSIEAMIRKIISFHNWKKGESDDNGG
ncbi:MAG: AAA family ATPase [Ruminococcus sp.]|nr:AAA family ATPase [Ruminococcus sp.]